MFSNFYFSLNNIHNENENIIKKNNYESDSSSNCSNYDSSTDSDDSDSSEINNFAKGIYNNTNVNFSIDVEWDKRPQRPKKNMILKNFLLKNLMKIVLE